jgi:hypothetical protein
VTAGTASLGPAGHADQAEQPSSSEETTMRHALVPVHLMHSARTAAASSRYDAEPETDETYGRPARRNRRSRRLATRVRRTRA